MNKIQAVKYKCCGKIFAVCCEPECYTDKKWLKNLKEYVEAGDVVEMIERGSDLKLELCECNKNQLELGI